MAARCKLLVILKLVFILQLIQAYDNSLIGSIKWKNWKPTATSVQEETVMGLIKRVLPERWSEFQVKVTGKSTPFSNNDTFSIETVDGKILITATSGVEASYGFNYYLKEFCGCHISWAGSQLNVSSPLPVVLKPVNVIVTHGIGYMRYYQNVCTPSYSFVWWKWSQWEKQIDWMALNGINLPLALMGQEVIYKRVYLSLGLASEELDQYFSGPGYLAWQRMGNIHNVNGPLSSNWMKEHVLLQHSVLKRMRSFGIVPVLQAFAGIVPSGLKRLYPNATISPLSKWGHFNCSYSCNYFLDPADPLFIQIGKQFTTEMIKEYGTDHIYSADTFNEMTPSSSDPSYLLNAGKSVYSAMKAADPDARWLMQGWLFFFNTNFWKPPQVKALLTSVPKTYLIVLDLYAEFSPQYSRLKSFYGVPFIWCMLNNFGGTLGMRGFLEAVNKGPFAALNTTIETNIWGIGLTPEGINQNDVMYEFMMENAWVKEPRDSRTWLYNYAKRRYGQSNLFVELAWSTLQQTVYSQRGGDNGKYIMVARPSLHMRSTIWYDKEEFWQAWDNFMKALAASQSLSESSLFVYDLVDVSRQSIQLIVGQVLYPRIIDSYQKKNTSALHKYQALLLEIMNDLDRLLGSDGHFLLGTWLSSAKLLATNAQERVQYERNARMQITLWGPTGEIRDYACKQWSGLINSYYKQRWTIFFEFLNDSLAKGQPFNQTLFNIAVFKEVEQPFVMDQSLFPSVPSGDTVAIAKELYQKYRGIAADQISC